MAEAVTCARVTWVQSSGETSTSFAGIVKDVSLSRANHHPHDVEDTAFDSHVAILRGGGAAFLSSGQHEDRLVLILELDRRMFDAADEERRRSEGACPRTTVCLSTRNFNLCVRGVFRAPAAARFSAKKSDCGTPQAK